MENNSSLSHDHGQWQDSVKCEIENQQSQQQEHTLSHPGKDHSSRPEVISKGSNSEHLHSKTPKECDSPKVEQEPGTSAPQSGIVAQQQSVNQMKSQQPPGSNQTNSAITMVKPPVVTFHMLIPILRRHLDKDRDMQVQSIFAKLRKNEISKEHFLKVVRSIVGDKLLKQAASQYQMRHAALAQRNPKTNPSNSTVSNQVSVQPNVSSCPMPGGEQKARPVAQPIPVKQATDILRPPHFRPLSGQMPDGKGIHMLQSCPPNIHSVQAQPMRHHVQHLQAPSPVFGTNNFHARPFPRPVGGSVALLRPQMVDSSQRAQLVQGAVTTIAGGVPTRPSMPGIVPINQSARHHLGNKEQRTNSSTSTAHTNMETISQQSDATTNSIPAMHAQQINPALGSSKGGIVMEHQSPSSSQTHQSHATKAEPKMQVQSSVQASAPAASKTPQKKASSGQKKALETLGSSPPPSSKKQKTSGGFHDQSIDQLNDVTAVSGVNLREEEEQLFSAPKEESRVSEAARKVVQLEEEKLILRKGPLTKKLADISLRKCNLKVIGTDVEHCLSMTFKDIDDKMRTTAANAAARVAAGGYDMLSKWQMIAERNKQKSEGGDGSSGYLPDNMLPHKPSPRSGKDSREQQEIEKRGYSTMIGSGMFSIL
ncbi:hypothetical protein PR202_ga31018 [Eleusine coracana subsp. coracana]|uniref:RST domain-containing protein n=1 Tax=Eleusine coracana subsp. coracana TaxID=191504 RepID=A0AAV5DQV4_ELECO|nr:hypothetical protein PR202_ga31018 [Eleusine coracana subsp. coracana]